MKRRKEVKGTRKRRLSRLSSAILPEAISGPAPKFDPTTAEWQCMGKACGCPLDAADKEEIGNLVDSYFDVQR